MKITRSKLKQIIREELESVAALSEVEWRPTDVPRGPVGDEHPQRKKEREDYIRQSTRARASIDYLYRECLQANGGIDSDVARVKCDAELKEAIKEELGNALSEVEDMSRKGNAGEDFAIPSAAWDRAFRKNGIKISYHGRMGVERDEWSKDKAQEYSGITYWPLYPVKGGYMGAYGRIYNALSDSGGGHALNLVDDAIEEARKMCERGEYTKTGRYETSGVTPGACKKMGWITPAE